MSSRVRLTVGRESAWRQPSAGKLQSAGDYAIASKEIHVLHRMWGAARGGRRDVRAMQDRSGRRRVDEAVIVRDGQPVRVPWVCCCCLEPSNTTDDVKLSSRILGGRATLTIPIPWCTECRGHRRFSRA